MCEYRSTRRLLWYGTACYVVAGLCFAAIVGGFV